MDCSHNFTESQGENTNQALQASASRKRAGLQNDSSATSLLDPSEQADQYKLWMQAKGDEYYKENGDLSNKSPTF